MTIFKQTTISLFTAVFVSIFVYGSYTIYAESNVTFDFRKEEDYITAIDRYHGEMNKFFNGKIRTLRELTEDDDFLNDPAKRKVFEVPTSIDKKNDDLPTIVEKCNENGSNVSTYCVSMEALQIYMEYIRHLEVLKGTFEDSSGGSAMQKVSEMLEKNEIIEKEVESSRAIMEATIATYNEFSLAYPMHKKYRYIAKELVKYKLILKDIRKRVMLFPIKFIDASSSQCK